MNNVFHIPDGMFGLLLSTSDFSPSESSTQHDVWLPRQSLTILTFADLTSAQHAKMSLDAAKIPGLTVVALYKEQL